MRLLIPTFFALLFSVTAASAVTTKWSVQNAALGASITGTFNYDPSTGVLSNALFTFAPGKAFTVRMLSNSGLAARGLYSASTVIQTKTRDLRVGSPDINQVHAIDFMWGLGKLEITSFQRRIPFSTPVNLRVCTSQTTSGKCSTFETASVTSDFAPAPVPVPASGLLLVGALAGAAAWRCKVC